MYHGHLNDSCFNKLKNQINQQEIVIQLRSFNTKSSETVRRITFQFDKFMTFKPNHKLIIDKQFLIWFIGFVEGDGSFVISKQKVYFDLTQNLKDINLLYKIKNTLGFGSILTRTDNNRNVGVYYITGKDNFLRLAYLFNGNLITKHKKDQFKIWLNVLNRQYNYPIMFIESTLVPSFENAWLSGFIDAEGYFATRVKNCRTSKRGKNVFIDFAISQKQNDVLILIRGLFNIKNQTNIRYDSSWHGYTFHLSNKKLLIRLIKYLKKFTLKTKKNMDFLIWSKIHNFTINKMHLNEQGLNQVIQMCNWKKQKF
jgi:hypothetical protein